MFHVEQQKGGSIRPHHQQKQVVVRRDLHAEVLIASFNLHGLAKVTAAKGNGISFGYP